MSISVGDYLSQRKSTGRSDSTLRSLLRSQVARAELNSTLVALFTPADLPPPGYTTAALATIEDAHWAASPSWLADDALDQSLAVLFSDDERYLVATSDKFGLPMHVVRASSAYRAAGKDWEIAFQIGLTLYAKLMVGSIGDSRPARHLKWHRSVVTRLLPPMTAVAA